MDLGRSFSPALALAALSVAVAAGFSRLVAGDGWWALVVLAALLPHAIGLATRTRAVGLQVGGWGVGLLAYLTWAVVPATTWFGLPGTATFAEIGDRLERGLTVLREQSAPVPERPGVVLVAVVAVWAAAAVADWLAFRRGATIGALAPGVTVFIWIAALSPGAADAAAAAGAVAVTAAAFLALQHQVLQTQRRAAVGDVGAVPAPRQVAGGVALALVAALVAAVVAPSLPGAGADPLVDLRDDGPGSSTYQTSIPPLVDVADNLRLGEQIDLFSVAAPSPQYWRTVALDRYADVEGGQWTLSASGGEIARGLDGPVPGDALLQDFEIDRLGERWMPAVFAPLSVDRSDTLVVESSLTLVTDRRTVRGLRYAVASSPPPAELTEAQRRATAAPPEEDVERYAVLPDTVPGAVRELAEEVTAGASTAYDKAIALRDYFRGGDFTYDPEVDLDDAVDATLAFLEIRRGFCVQFASTYALMARAVGIPSRVAVGFTPGTIDPVSGRYVVSNYEAHAWPEVWLAGVGWTNRFEPTPTGAGPGGSDLPGDTAAAAIPEPAETPATTLAPAPAEPEPVTPTPEAGAPPPDADAGGGDDGTGIPAGVVLAVVGVLVVGAALAAVPFAKARRRSSRRRRAEPASRVAGAWEEAVDHLRELGSPRPVSITPAEVAVGADPIVGPDAASSLAHLADAHTAAQFGVAPVTEADAEAAWHDFDEFRHALDGHLGLTRRLRARLAPLVDRRVGAARTD